MSLYEHLDELRSRIVRACISIGAAFVIGIILARPLLDYIRKGANTEGFDVVSPTDPITLYFKVALYIAVVIALPMILYQLIAFLSPGLTKKEKRLLFSASAVRDDPLLHWRCFLRILLCGSESLERSCRTF